jgi:alpha-L-rhamnosidase
VTAAAIDTVTMRLARLRAVVPEVALACVLGPGCAAGPAQVGVGGPDAAAGSHATGAAGSGPASGGSGSGSGSGTTAGTTGAAGIEGGVADAGAPDAGALPVGDPHVTRLRAEYRVDPLGIDVARPRLDWILQSPTRGQRQTAYQILVSASRAALDAGTGDLWDTGKVVSDQSNQLEYAGKALGARQRAWWKVRVWDKDDLPSAWSDPAWWEMGLLAPADWQARWVAGPAPGGLPDDARWIWFSEGDPLTLAPTAERFFRRAFTLPAGSEILTARVNLSVDDEFELFINGASVGAGTSWKDVGSFDVRARLTTGANVIAIRARNTGGGAGFIGALDVTFATGPPLRLRTDATWKASNLGAAALAGYQATAYDDAAWSAAKDLAALGAEPWGRPAGGTMPAYLRKGFSVAKKVASARVYATALGLYELWLNGKRVGADHLTPGWTDYRKRLQVQTTDVTDLITVGDNAVGAILADGWFNGKVGYFGRTDVFGSGPNRLLAQLELTFDDGTRQIVATDGGTSAGAWRWSTGGLFAADLLDGEIYDGRLEPDGWSSPGFVDGAWAPAPVFTETSTRRLVADPTAGVQITEERTPISLKEIRPNVFIYDLGQNMVGWERLRVQGTRGSSVRLRFAEVLNTDGTLYTDNLRGAKATDVYTLRGGAEEIFQPRFTTHGYRYVELTGDIAGLAKKPDLTSVTGLVAHSFMAPAGTFETSSALVNQLQSNIVWGQRGNFVSVPTDCPQRDERLGWMGDAQIFARTATFNMDVASFYTKWMRDVADSQTPSGAFPNVAPNPGETAGTPAWGDAGVIVPWTIYLAYGDTRILTEHYAAMAAWVNYIRSANANFLWQTQRGSDFGDWIAINADTDKEVIATAFYAHAADIMSRVARVLGKSADAATYTALFQSIKTAFQTAYVAADGKIRGDTQTAYALALRFGLLSDAQRAIAVKHLADNVVAHGNHLTSGFVGIAHLLPALTADGRVDVAYQLLNQETFPSWFYSIKKGATTIWERWDGIQTNGGFQTPVMNSFNHYSLGSVGEWMYGVIAGIDLDEARPGYKHVIVRPRPGGGLTSARGKLDTIYGPLATAWTLAAGVFTLEVAVPPNATASVFLPFSRDVRQDGAAVSPAADGSYPLGSGTYTFTAASP